MRRASVEHLFRESVCQGPKTIPHNGLHNLALRAVTRCVSYAPLTCRRHSAIAPPTPDALTRRARRDGARARGAGRVLGQLGMAAPLERQLPTAPSRRAPSRDRVRRGAAAGQPAPARVHAHQPERAARLAGRPPRAGGDPHVPVHRLEDHRAADRPADPRSARRTRTPHVGHLRRWRSAWTPPGTPRRACGPSCVRPR